MKIEKFVKITFIIFMLVDLFAIKLNAKAALTAGGLVTYPTHELSPNLLNNSGFENLDETNKPIGWSGSTWGDPGFSVDSTVLHSGINSIKLHNSNLTQFSDSYSQTLNLKKGAYKFSGWIKMDSIASTIGSGVRLSLTTPFVNGVNNAYGGGNTEIIKGTADWQYFEVKNAVITNDTVSAKITLSPYGEPDGTAWFDDLELHEELPTPIDVFMLYPNYRGYLFDDQSQNMKFDVTVNPPLNTQFSDYQIESSIVDESNLSVVNSNTFSAMSNFTATLDGDNLVNDKTYLIYFKLIRLADFQEIYVYPAYRVSKVTGASRSAMAISFDEKNRILMDGESKFLLGVYDSGMGYNLGVNWWDNFLTTNRRLFELPINMYNNYWYGNSTVQSMNDMGADLQNHGIKFLHTGNCFGSGQFNPSTFPIYTNDEYLSGLSQIKQLAGFYTMDECIPSSATGVFEQYQRLKSFKPDGITFGASTDPATLTYWRDTNDLLSLDPYPLYSAEPVQGYPFSQVADWTKKTKDVLKNSRPFATVIQFFKFTSQGRWPTQYELRNMSYMAIVEGSNGLMYWSLGNGNGALATVCTDWCAEKVDYFTRLKNVITEIASLQEALSNIDYPEKLIANSNSSIHTRVKFVNGKGYLIAYNYTGSDTSTTFTWEITPVQINVYNESRQITNIDANFTDSFMPYEAHVYEILTTPTIYTINDVATLISNWLKTGASSDLNVDNIVNTKDLGIMMSKWQ